jgi:hypothetical protein
LLKAFDAANSFGFSYLPFGERSAARIDASMDPRREKQVLRLGRSFLLKERGRDRYSLGIKAIDLSSPKHLR